MSDEKYYAISNSDGDTSVREFDSPEELLKLFEDPDSDDGGMGRFMADIPASQWGDKKEYDTNCWPQGAVLIVKGRIVVPQVVEVVEEFRLE